jgi:hypothetical protein
MANFSGISFRPQKQDKMLAEIMRRIIVTLFLMADFFCREVVQLCML